MSKELDCFLKRVPPYSSTFAAGRLMKRFHQVEFNGNMLAFGAVLHPVNEPDQTPCTRTPSGT